jgi:glucose-6-phosphate isomerase
MLSPQIKDLSLSKGDFFKLERESINKDKLTFRNLIYSNVEEIKSIGEEIRKKYKNYVIVGIGGSDLGSRTIVNALENKSGVNILFIGSNTDPDELDSFFNNISLEDSVFNIISKSGETIEIIANFLYIESQIEKQMGRDKVEDHIIITTSEPKSTIRDLASEYNIQIIEGISNVGDRFSVLSIIGLLTVDIMGLNIDNMIKGAQEIDEQTNSLDPEYNDALAFSQLQYLYFSKMKKNISVLMPYSKRLERFGFWYRQLWAESLGKKLSLDNKEIYAGITPIASLGSTDQHSQIQLYNEGPNDKVITFIIPDHFDSNIKIKTNLSEVSYLDNVSFEDIIKKERLATSISLMENSRTNGTIFIDRINENSLGELFFFFEMAVSYLGVMFNINTFNQPGVEKGKEYMYALLSKPGFEKEKEKLSKYT